MVEKENQYQHLHKHNWILLSSMRNQCSICGAYEGEEEQKVQSEFGPVVKALEEYDRGELNETKKEVS